MLEGKPTKKELEAKGRKALRADRRMDKLRTKMNALADDGDSTASSKLKAIESLIKKNAKKKKEVGKQYVVGSRGGKKKVVGGDSRKGARVKYVDKRMKKDKRGIKRAQQKNHGRMPK